MTEPRKFDASEYCDEQRSKMLDIIVKISKVCAEHGLTESFEKSRAMALAAIICKWDDDRLEDAVLENWDKIS